MDMESSGSVANVDELKTLANENAIEHLVRLVGRRLWFNCFKHYLAIGFQFSAGIFLLSGLFHLLVQSLPVLTVSIFALIPLMIGLIISIQKKPTDLECAGYADSQFNKQALMSTAVDILRRKSKNSLDYSPWVIHQASQASQQCLLQLKGHPIIKFDRYTRLACYSALLGIFFMLQPGSTRVTANQQHKEVNEIKVNKKAELSLFSAIKKQQKNLQPVDPLDSEKPINQNEGTKNNTPLEHEQVWQERNDFSPTLKQRSLLNSEQMMTKLQLENLTKQNDESVGDQADTNPTLLNTLDDLKMNTKKVEISIQDGHLVNKTKAGLAFKKQQSLNINTMVVDGAVSKIKFDMTTYHNRFSPRQQQLIKAYQNQKIMQK